MVKCQPNFTRLMKKRIFRVSLLALFAVVTSIASYGQTARVWSFGPEVGVNFSKHGMDLDDSDYKTGLLAGAFLTYSIQDQYALTLKALYSQKGASTEEGGVTTKTQLNYIEIPVLARIFFNREGTVRPNVFLGPSFGFLTGAKAKIEDGDYETFENYDDFYNSFDFGLSAGLGLSIKVGGEMYFVVDARYTYGLTDIAKGETKANNQAVAISAGLSFGIGD
jgi:Outer membrane protein beta-barrel domain